MEIKKYFLLIFCLFIIQVSYATNFEVTGDQTIPANSNFSNNSDYGIYLIDDNVDDATLTLEGDIFISSNTKGIYCGNKHAVLTLRKNNTDSTIYTSSNSKVGIQAQYTKDCRESSTISIYDINICSDSDNIGLFSCGTLNINGNITNKNTITLLNSKTAAIQVNAGGSFTAENVIINSNANNFVLLTGKTSTTTFKNSTVTIDSKIGFLSKQSDVICFEKSSFINKQEHFLTATEKNFISYKTDITLDNSLVEGYINNQSNKNKISLNIKNNSVWKIKNNSNVDELNISNSKVDLTATDNTQFNTLTVDTIKGTGENEIILNTVLAGDDSSTDKIIITKEISGNFTLNVNNVGGTGKKTETGIKIVDTTVENNNDTFKLKNSKIDIGAYIYTLQQGSDDDKYSWFLRTNFTPQEKTDAFVVISNTPQFMNLALKAGMNELTKRLGDIRRTPINKYNGLWARTYGKNFNIEKDLDTKMNVFGIEAGYDFRLNKTTLKTVKDEFGNLMDVQTPNKNRYYLGIMAGYQNINKIETSHRNSSKDSTGTGTSKSVGLYGSYISKNGLFVDLAVRNFWMDFDMKTYSSNQDLLQYKPQRQQLALSVETGKEFLFGKNKQILFEPKVEVLFAYSPEIETSVNNDNIKYSSTNMISGQIGVMLGLINRCSNKKNWLPYCELAYNYDFSNKVDVTYANENQTIDFSGGYFDIGLGLNSYLGKSFSLFGLVSYENGNSQNNIAYNIGLRFGW